MTAKSSIFSLTGSVDRGTYLKWGIGLSILKYAVEALVINLSTGHIYTPVDFLSPLLSHRATYFENAPSWLAMSLVLWTLPFLWVAVGMSIRRCRDAEYSPWLAMFVLVPILNYAAMLWFSVASGSEPISAEEAEEQRQLQEIWEAPTAEPSLPTSASGDRSLGIVAAISGAAAGVVYALATTVLSVYVLGSYGAALFFGTPLVAGAVSAFLFNRPVPRSAGATVLQAILMIGCCCCGFLLFALEGVICIVMALPILIPLALMGALLGRSIAVETCRPQRETQGLMWCLAGLPLLAATEGFIVPQDTFSVSTTVEIQSSPEIVWNQVIAFPEITEQPEWFFRSGIAAPLRAHIDGTGVGATRYCEFTTGTFVEPITVWEQNSRLAFDVTKQPDPMFELTPYRHVHPPHLDSGFRSTRGEFLLEPMPAGGTRLIGTTWYNLNMHPQAYWTLWSDELVHRIHLRVLNHIQRTSEAKQNK